MGATAKDAVIGWFHGEFTTANVMIDGRVQPTLQRRHVNWFPVLHMQKFYPVADVTSLGAAVGCYCYLEEEAASTVTHEATEDLPTEAMPKYNHY
ncbi:hypothetical protein SORBI_3005G135100 [Sorghum bicolor]|uniref:Uncharacterized protein n=1 Tax=Sorghum bicolor TaxID=4558 RepID=C5Y3E0_SORBI|nr:hypothetical protein SORBI_3005G135100 [Sorghum bicolor]